MPNFFLFGSRKINFSLEFDTRKLMNIKVHPDGSVRIIAPLNSPEKLILDKLKSKAPWILKQTDFFESFKPSTPPRRFINGETHLYLGRQYRLKLIKWPNNEIKAYRGQIQILAKEISKGALEKQLELWYKGRASIIFNDLLDEIVPKFRKHKLSKPKMVIRKMAIRWGSCTPRGKISLNPELVKAPKGCIEYVIIHEMCHLVHHNHTKQFYDLQSRILPDWEKWKMRLERFGY